MADAVFTRRVQMIEAYRKDDFQTINALLKEDEYLKSFSEYLDHLVRKGEYHALEASLGLSNLDKNNAAYSTMMLQLTLTAAVCGDRGMLDILLPLSEEAPLEKRPADSATRALSHIFNSMTPGNLAKPDVSIGKYLIEKGADIDQASLLQESQLTAQIRHMAKTLKEVLRYKAEIYGKKTVAPKKSCVSGKCGKSCGQ